MNRSVTRIGILLAGLGLLAAVAAQALPAQLWVQVREGQLRHSPSFLGKIVARLPLGAPVSVVSEQGAWVKVTAGPDQGWLHTSAVSSGRAGLAAGAAMGGSATRDEVALAGKGFDQSVEETFRRQNPRLDFAVIDRMDSFSVTTEEMQTFMTRGGLPLLAAGGGQ